MTFEITISMTEEFYKEFNKMLQATGDSSEQFMRKAIGLYKLSMEAKQNGKVIGIADNADKLETEFIGL